MLRKLGVKTIPNKKVDIVVVAARYEPDSAEPRLEFAQVYEHRGPIWTDIKLYDRNQMIEALRDGKRMWSGQVANSVLSFDVAHKLILIDDDEGRQERLSYESEADDRSNGPGDDIGVPLL